MKMRRMRAVCTALFVLLCVGITIQRVWLHPYEMPITVVYAEEPQGQDGTYTSPNNVASVNESHLFTSDPDPDAMCAIDEHERERPRIDVNNADAERLMTLPGIGPAYAERIIALRKERDGFIFKEELLDVSGIGQTRYANLEPLICLNPYRADTDA